MVLSTAVRISVKLMLLLGVINYIYIALKINYSEIVKSSAHQAACQQKSNKKKQQIEGAIYYYINAVFQGWLLLN